jgi:hypothetical protein
MLMLITGCTVTRPSQTGKQHPVRPDICPKAEIVEWAQVQYLPGDKVYLEFGEQNQNVLANQYRHQRCYDLYGNCAHYVIDEDIFSGDDIGCLDWGIDKETCLAKGGEWYNYIIADWCWYPYIEE